jgi:deoxyribodipyrimidine photo-lyase
MRVAIALFTRDLRLHDQPALAAAARDAEHVVPLFVREAGLLARSDVRAGFLDGALADLDGGLRERGARLVVRHGDAADETARLARELGAGAVYASADVSAFARRREQRLRLALSPVELRLCPGVTVVPPGELVPASGGDHYRVFAPYHNAWSTASWRAPERPPQRISVPRGAGGEPLPHPHGDAGETAGRARMEAFLRTGLRRYGDHRDDLDGESTSRLSHYLHLGCVSPLELALAAGPGPYQRQLAWRDFFHQVLWAVPGSQNADLVPLRYCWDDDDGALDAWKQGRTGYPVVDAAMRQLLAEGFMPNRARMIVASFLTKDLNLDWRLGAAHFDRHLVDGDVANNVGGWQWVAGTGVDARPGRMFNPTLQARRFDRRGDYVRRHVPELEHLDGSAIHEPWKAEGSLLDPDYPAPIVDHAEAASRYRARFRRG